MFETLGDLPLISTDAKTELPATNSVLVSVSKLNFDLFKSLS